MKYIGLDAHSRTCVFVVLGKSGKVLRRARVKTTETEILEFVKSVKGARSLVFEEGVISQWLYLLLRDVVDKLVVCQPEERKGAKTDKLDALELADLLRVNRLKPVFHDDSEYIKLRATVSGYDDLVSGLVRAKNRYKALFRQVAIPTEGRGFYKSPETISLLQTQTQQYVATKLFEQIELLERQKSEYEELFKSNSRTLKQIRLLTTIPGIGAIRANQIMAIVVTPHRFPTKYDFYSYAMLTKYVHESGGKTYGKKRARNHSTLKGIFKCAVKDAMKSKNTAFCRKYDEMRENGAEHHAAQNAVCKMQAATVLGVLKSGKKYDDKKWEVTRRRNQNQHKKV